MRGGHPGVPGQGHPEGPGGPAGGPLSERRGILGGHREPAGSGGAPGGGRPARRSSQEKTQPRTDRRRGRGGGGGAWNWHRYRRELRRFRRGGKRRELHRRGPGPHGDYRRGGVQYSPGRIGSQLPGFDGFRHSGIIGDDQSKKTQFRWELCFWAFK